MHKGDHMQVIFCFREGLKHTDSECNLQIRFSSQLFVLLAKPQRNLKEKMQNNTKYKDQ